MIPLFSIILLILSLVGCMVFKLDLVYGLLIGMFSFMAAAVHSGFFFKSVLLMMWHGIRESFIVVGVLLIIGAMTGIWRGCGTIQQLVVYGTELIHPRLFILYAFLLPAEKLLEKFSSRISLFTITALTGIPLIMFSCNQTLALMLHVPLLRPLYQKRGLSKERLMLDIADTTVLFSALVPWCLACSMPLEMLGASAACIPFAFFLYTPAVVSFFRNQRDKRTVPLSH